LIIWINREVDASLSPSPTDPGVGWERVGTADSMVEKDLVLQVQARLGLRGTRSVSTDFFLSGEPESGWVSTAHEADEPFLLAIDPMGDGTYLRAVNPARVGTFARRTPEPHPGLVTPPVFIPIRLTNSSRGLFDRPKSAD
jgi:hypothetical protein